MEEAWLRRSDPNVNLMTGAACTLAETLLATCGNGHFWAIPAIEAWYWLLGVPTLGVLAYYPIRSSYYQVHTTHRTWPASRCLTDLCDRLRQTHFPRGVG